MRHGTHRKSGNAWLKRIWGIRGKEEFFLSLRKKHLLVIRKLLSLAECYDCPISATCNKTSGPCRELEKILEDIE